MDAYLGSMVSRCLITTIIRQGKLKSVFFLGGNVVQEGGNY